MLFVRYDAVVDHLALQSAGDKRLANGRPAGVGTLPARRLVAARHDRHAHHGRTNSPLLPPALCSSSTLPMLMPRSIALHMSYTVSAATAAADGVRHVQGDRSRHEH